MSWLWRILAFFGLPTWVLPVAMIGLASGVVGGAYLKGRSDGNANCNAASLKLKIDILERDALVQRRASKFEDEATVEIAGETARLEMERIKYANQVQSKGRVCILDADDIDADARRMR